MSVNRNMTVPLGGRCMGELYPRRLPARCQRFQNRADAGSEEQKDEQPAQKRQERGQKSVHRPSRSAGRVSVSNAPPASASRSPSDNAATPRPRLPAPDRATSSSKPSRAGLWWKTARRRQETERSTRPDPRGSEPPALDPDARRPVRPVAPLVRRDRREQPAAAARPGRTAKSRTTAGPPRKSPPGLACFIAGSFHGRLCGAGITQAVGNARRQ